jgi:hypothetical protein
MLYPTKRLAQRALDAHIAHVNKISYRPMPTAKFADFAQNWESKVLSQYRESTAINYRTHIWKHLVPFFGEYSMKDLNPEMIQQFVSTSVVSPKTTVPCQNSSRLSFSPCNNALQASA